MAPELQPRGAPWGLDELLQGFGSAAWSLGQLDAGLWLRGLGQAAVHLEAGLAERLVLILRGRGLCRAGAVRWGASVVPAGRHVHSAPK